MSATYSSEIWDSSVIRVSSPGPHEVDQEVGQIEEDGDLAQGSHQIEGEEEDSGEAQRLEGADGRHEYDVARHGQGQQDLQYKGFYYFLPEDFNIFARFLNYFAFYLSLTQSLIPKVQSNPFLN